MNALYRWSARRVCRPLRSRRTRKVGAPVTDLTRAPAIRI
ncbi:uncharacterized protein AruCF_1453 [Achromobacter ruhlandii]|nr:uncharacterized protein AruCF_1453 [Achromobacter ruhlandii]